ncbi:MAG: ABC transporter permease [Planctomycetota bacterium]|jgi:putative ABC transport system permease protein
MHQIKIVRNIWSGIENLLLHKLRSLLTMLGIVFGVGSVVAMLSVGEGASKEALEQIRKLGSNNIIISSMKAVEDEASTTAHSHLSIYGLTYDDYARVLESFGTITRAVSVKLIRKESRLGERALELRVVGTTPTWFRLVPRKTIAGRVLLSEDEQDQAAVAVLTEWGARRLLATEHTIGQSIRIGLDVFEVVGIVKSEGGKAQKIRKWMLIFL